MKLRTLVFHCCSLRSSLYLCVTVLCRLCSQAAVSYSHAELVMFLLQNGATVMLGALGY